MIFVDLVINCYEKNYTKVLDKDFIENIIAQNRYKFKNIIIIINNVKNRKRVERIAKELKREKIIDKYFFVEDYLEKVLNKVDLRKEDLGKVIHYTDWALVALYVSQNKYLLHWDPDIFLEKPYDWITQSLVELEKNKDYLAAAPLSKLEEKSIRKESYKDNKNFIYNNDFSDQVFLIKTKEFLRPIYRFRHIYALRVPLAEFGSIFEKRIDSYMKKTGKTRILNKNVKYIHLDKNHTPYPNRKITNLIKHYLYMVIIVVYYYCYLTMRNFFKKHSNY